MQFTPEQKAAIDRLYENESLTENLTDVQARALLHWAQDQITADVDGALVQAAVSAANTSGEVGVQALLGQASAFLVQELTARGLASPASLTSPAELAPVAPAAPAPPTLPAPEDSPGEPSPPPTNSPGHPAPSPPLLPERTVPRAEAGEPPPAPLPAPAKKPRRRSNKRTSKKSAR